MGIWVQGHALRARCPQCHAHELPVLPAHLPVCPCPWAQLYGKQRKSANAGDRWAARAVEQLMARYPATLRCAGF
jgi:hypothetical protein